MKNLILSLFVLSLFVQTTYAQIKADSTGIYMYRKIIENDQTKGNNYKRIKSYIALNYRSAPDVIKLDTEDQIIAKGNYDISIYGYKHFIDHTLIFDIKDNKVRVTYTDFKVNIKDQTNNFENKGHWLNFPNKEKVIQRSSEKLMIIYADLEKYLKTNIKEDW